MTIPQYARKNLHAFDQSLAINVGLKAAIVYQHVRYWIDINVRNIKSIKNGRVWMYETQEDMASFFGYLSEKEVREALQLLYEQGLLDRDRLADNPFDRTWWYALPLEKGQEIKNSNSCYEGDQKGVSEGDKKAPSEGDKKAPSIERTIQEKEKEQQQAASPPSAAVFSCLKEISLDESAIKKLMEFPEERVEFAVKFMKSQKTPPDKPAGMLIWHCTQKTPPPVAESKDEMVEKNRMWAKKREEEWLRNRTGCRIDALKDCCQVVIGGQKGTIDFSYEDAKMIEKLKEELKKRE